MEARMSILFYGKKNKLTSHKLLPVYLRVTIDGQRFEVSTQRFIEPGKWSLESGKVKGNSEEARTINTYLDRLKQRVYQYQKESIQEGQLFNVETLRTRWFGIGVRSYKLLEIFRQHNTQMEKLIGIDFEKPTYVKFNTTLDHTTTFIRWKYNVSDLELTQLSYSFLADFEFWLKSERKCNHNTTLKYLSNLRKIVNSCIKNGWLEKDPFFGFKMSKKEVAREILTNNELLTVITKDFENSRLNQVRDILVFSCYTGFAYADAQKLKRSDVCVGIVEMLH